jgi:phosphopantothenoylcysteine decarboxylase/phosphopantothenate--cysteine ligase
VNPGTVTKTVVIGVGGGIAAYKVCGLIRRFREAGHVVIVIPTPSALKFVGETTWAALSGNPIRTSVWESVHDVPHVRIGQQADLVFVAPATADLMSRAANGAANDLLTSTLLTARCPVVFAPAMHTEMWEHPATVANVSTLRRRGAVVLDPEHGRLTGADSGPGRLPEANGLFAIGDALLTTSNRMDLLGQRVVISAGGTREPLDPVRYLGNRSSGKMGYSLAAAAISRGAEVTVIAANVELSPVPSATTVGVQTADELQTAVIAAAGTADIVIMAAAVADFRPVEFFEHKIKKGSPAEPTTIELTRNTDILAELVQRRQQGQSIVGFAAETGDQNTSVLEFGRRKLTSKGCDLLVVNDVSAGSAFGSEENEVVILTASGGSTLVERTTKSAVAGQIWDAILEFRR